MSVLSAIVRNTKCASADELCEAIAEACPFKPDGDKYNMAFAITDRCARFLTSKVISNVKDYKVHWAKRAILWGTCCGPRPNKHLDNANHSTP